MRAERRKNDFYQTPSWMTRALLHHVPEIGGSFVLEPCAGDLSIAKVLIREGGCTTFTADVDGTSPAHYAGGPFCASRMDYIASGAAEWIVTNPPYSMPLCTQIVATATQRARVGVAMMLRISFVEPTDTRHPRGPFLERFPMSRMLVMPRHSFTGNGKSDSATTAWMIWSKVPLSGPPILSLYKADERFGDPVTSLERSA